MSMLDFAIKATTEYIDHMPKSQRKKYGQFFTSKETAAFMAELFEIPDKRQTLSILDPGAGSGILSVALLERLQAFSAIKEIRLVCYENDPNVMELLRANLEVARSQSKQKISYEIVSDNYILSQATDYNLMLGANWEPEKFDFVIGNPPYMKTEDIKTLTPLEKPIYESNYKSAYKQYDKYFLFLERSLQLLSKNGMVGYILPNKFMKVGAALELRKLLKNNQYIKEIVSFGANQVFKDKTTYTNILILTEQSNEQIEYSEVNKLNDWLLRSYDYDKYSNKIVSKNLSDDGWIMYPKYLETIYNKILQNTICLKEFVGSNNILNGIQTSRNDYYVFKVNKEDSKYYYFDKNEEEYKIEKEVVRPYYETPNVESDDSLSTYKRFEPNSFVIYPYKSVDDKVRFIEIKELQEHYPECYNYFVKNKEKFIYSAKGGKRDIKPAVTTENEWYRYGRQQALKIGDIKKKIVVGVLSQGDKYAIDEFQTLISSGGTAGYCMIVLPENSQYSIYYLQAILNSKCLEWLASLHGEIFRGGYIARGTKVLEKLPIKTIDFKIEQEKILHDKIASYQEKLISINQNIILNKDNHRQYIIYKNDFKRTKQLLDNELLSLYGMSQEEFDLIPDIKDFYAAN